MEERLKEIYYLGKEAQENPAMAMKTAINI